MVWNIFAWWFNYVERMRERKIYADIHAELYKEGYTQQLSFYGTLIVPYDDKHVQARIEVMMTRQLTGLEVHILRDMMSHLKIDREYTLFTFDGNRLLEVLPQ